MTDTNRGSINSLIQEDPDQFGPVFHAGQAVIDRPKFAEHSYSNGRRSPGQAGFCT